VEQEQPADVPGVGGDLTGPGQRAPEESVTEMMLNAFRSAQRRLAERNARPAGNMSHEFPPYEPRNSAQVSRHGPLAHELLRSLVDTLDARRSLEPGDVRSDASHEIIEGLLEASRALTRDMPDNLGNINPGIYPLPTNALASKYNEELSNLLLLAKAAGGGEWNIDGSAAESGTVYHGDGDTVCTCYPSIGALPDAIASHDIARYIEAVSPAKIVRLAAEMARISAQMTVFARCYNILIQNHAGAPSLASPR
jgi:hypothetical protein